MNYNLIFNEDTGEYVHIHSKEGVALVNHYSSFLKNESHKKIKIDKKYLIPNTYTISLTSIGKMKYKLLLSNIEDIHSSLEHVLLYIIHMFIQDNLYTSINLYHFIYTVYKCKYHVMHNYRLLEVYSHDDNHDDNHDDVLKYYTDRYSLSEKTINTIIFEFDENIFDSIKYLLDIHTYTDNVHICYTKHFIKKHNI